MFFDFQGAVTADRFEEDDQQEVDGCHGQRDERVSLEGLAIAFLVGFHDCLLIFVSLVLFDGGFRFFELLAIDGRHFAEDEELGGFLGFGGLVSCGGFCLQSFGGEAIFGVAEAGATNEAC